MNGTMDTKFGGVEIDKEVIAKYAGTIAVESFGIVGMAMVSVRDGIAKLLKREKLTHGIEVIVDEDNAIILNFHVIVSYGVNIQTVCQNLMENVKYRVEEFCNMTVKTVNIFVEGVRRID